jgi:iron complex transport system ATP-binding protein
MSSPIRLRAESLSFAYEAGAPVLNDISADFEPGGLHAILGPNGSGKSTLLRLLCGMLRPQSGRVLLDGRNIHDWRGKDRARRIGFLPQAIAPAFSLSVFEVVCLGRYPHTGALGSLQQHDIEVVRRCLRETQTEAFATRDFDSLSGGERQRVLLAGILAQEPDLLLLDEPTSALDIHHQAEVLSLLRRLSRNGYGIVLVTHDLNLAARFCDSCVLIGTQHSVVASGPPASVLSAAHLSAAYDAPIRVDRHPATGDLLVTAELPAEAEA